MTSADVLVVRRLIAATPDRLFDAWTRPEQLVEWWGPGPVRCVGADVDLRVGGRYRIGNRLPEGALLWITGEFLVVERPQRLSYTWQLEGAASSGTAVELVTVRFDPRGDATEVSVTHERIADEATRKSHDDGWVGCLEKLAAYVIQGWAR
jgi:uncharacterized protein YndB with AHSA1/START domain